MVTEEDIKVLRIVYFAMGLGATVFALCVGLFTFASIQKNVIPTATHIQIVQALSYILIAFGLVIYPTANFIFKKVLKGSETQTSFPTRIKSAYVVRIALYEGIAFFGLVILFVSGINGVIHTQPIYLITCIPYFVLLRLLITTFPTKEKLEASNPLNSSRN